MNLNVQMHPVKFVGGPADGTTRNVWRFRKYRYLFEDEAVGRRVFKYRRRNKGAEYHLEDEYVVLPKPPLSPPSLIEEDEKGCE